MSSEAAGGLHLVGTLRRPKVINVRRSPTLAAERALRDLGMPPEEIRAVLVAGTSSCTGNA
jgi:hypothetical protein